MNLLPRDRFFASLSTTTPHHRIRRQLPHLSLAIILLTNTIGCTHNENPGNHIGPPPETVEVAAALLGAAAEVGIVALTKNHIAATAVGGIVGAGASYLLNQLELTCKACATTSDLQKEIVPDSTPAPIRCQNPGCAKLAYLVVSRTDEALRAILEYLRTNLQPTCLLTKELTAENEVQLRWVSHNATAASLNGDAVQTNGSLIVYPEQTTTYVLKVMGANGRSEDSVTIEVAEEEPTDEDDVMEPSEPPSPPPPPSPPRDSAELPVPAIGTNELTEINVTLGRIEVYEDGSLGATDWSFEMHLNDVHLITIPRRSFHDDDRRIVQFSRQAIKRVIQSQVVEVRVTGYNLDKHRRAEGSLRLPLNLLSGADAHSFHVSVPENYKKGHFLFNVTITK